MAVGVIRKRLTTANTFFEFLIFFFKYYRSLGDQSPVMQCCNKLCLECAVSVVLSVQVRACASLRHRHNSTSVQVSCFPGSRTVPAQLVQAGCVTQSLWNGERLAGGRVQGHGQELAAAAGNSMVPTLHMENCWIWWQSISQA